MARARLDRVDVSIGFPPFVLSGSFRPSKAEQSAAWELLVELTSRTTVTALRREDGLIREALTSYYQLFGLTRELLRKYGPEVGGDRHDGNLSLGLIAMRVLNEVLRPVLSKWHPLLASHEILRPATAGQPEWEQRWARAAECRAALTDVRLTVRGYVDVLGRIAGTPGLADAAVPLPPSQPAARERRKAPPPTGAPKARMVGWFDAVEGFATLFATRRGRRDDEARDGLTDRAPARPITTDLSDEAGDVWIDYAADLGDSFDPTMAVAWHLARPVLAVPHDPDDELPPVPDGGLPRGDLLILGGDEVYAFASAKRYENQTALPYACARDDEMIGRVLALPGNHDYFGGIKHFEQRFVATGAAEEPLGLRVPTAPGVWASAGQDRRWFTVKLPRNWWIWGIDTGLNGSIDEPQHQHFKRLVASDAFAAGDRIVLCTPVPLWQLRQKLPEEYQVLRQRIDEWLRPKDGSVAVFIAGDSHYFAQYDDIVRHERHVTVGGGGAFLHPTHSLAERVPSERGRPEFELKARWPSPADSRGLAPRFTMLRDRQFVWLGLIFAGVFGLAAWLASTQWLRLPWGADAPKRWPLDALSYVARVTLLWPVLASLCVVGMVITPPNAREHLLRRGARRYGLAFGTSLALVTFLGVVHAHWFVDRVIDAPSWRWPWFIGMAAVMAIALLLTFTKGVSWLCTHLRVNDNLAFSAVASTRFKHFVRFRFTGDGGLTLYVIGLDPVGENWWKAMQDRIPLPPSDSHGVPHLHYVWGTTIGPRSTPPPAIPGRIAVSISPPDSAHDPTSDAALARVFRTVVRGLLVADWTIAYGGRLDPSRGEETNFTHILLETAAAEAAASEGNGVAGPYVIDYLAAPMWLDRATVESSGVAFERCPAAPNAMAGPVHPLSARAVALTAMREQMARDCAARVVIGGRLTDYAGRFPGVIEEALATAAAGRPLYVVGGFGGAADALARHLHGEQVPELTARWQSAHTPGLRVRTANIGDPVYLRSIDEELGMHLPRGDWMSVRNGLSPAENDRLAVATEPSEILTLVGHGLETLFRAQTLDAKVPGSDLRVERGSPPRTTRDARVTRVFVSHLHGETAALRLMTTLNDYFPDWSILDGPAHATSAIEPGDTWGDRIMSETIELLGNCDVQLVVIGPRAITHPNEWLRREVEFGLSRDGLRVVPVLVDGADSGLTAAVDAKLLSRNARMLRNDRWDDDVKELAMQLARGQRRLPRRLR